MALKFWSMDADQDGDRASYVNVHAETKEEATLLFGIILGRPFHYYERISEDEILMSRDEVIAAGEERKRTIKAAAEYRANEERQHEERREAEAIRYLKSRGHEVS